MFDIAVTPDRGYCVSVRGVAREMAIAYGLAFTDPAAPAVPAHAVSAATWAGSGASRTAIADPSACDRFVLREVHGFDPARPRRCGCRSG